ncbi:MAG: hypothetical protein WCO28_01280 [Bacteroidota bacterium]
MNEIEIYKSSDNQIEIKVQFENETVWLSQKQMAELYDKNIMTVNEHIKNIYQEKELDENPTIRKSLIVQKEGKLYEKSTCREFRQVQTEKNNYPLSTINYQFNK